MFIIFSKNEIDILCFILQDGFRLLKRNTGDVQKASDSSKRGDYGRSEKVETFVGCYQSGSHPAVSRDFVQRRGRRFRIQVRKKLVDLKRPLFIL